MKYVYYILLLISSCSFGQVSKELLKAIKPLEEYKSFYDFDDKLERIENRIQKKSTPEELEYLAVNGKNSYVKVIALQLLMQMDEKQKLNRVFKSLILSKDTIVNNSTCVSYSKTFPVFIFEKLTFDKTFTKEKGDEIKSELVKSILNNKPINIPLLEEIYEYIPPNTTYYDDIRSLVITTKSPMLVATLAKYQNKNDIDLIKSFGKNSFEAIKNFPDNEFIPLLENHLNHLDDYYYISAVTKFCNKEVVPLISRMVDINIRKKENDTIDKFSIQITHDLMSANKCELYYPSLARFWEKSKVLSFEVMNFYEKKHNKEETADFILSGFLPKGYILLIYENMFDTSFLSHQEYFAYDEVWKLIKVLEKLRSLSEEKYKIALSNVILNSEDLYLEEFVIRLDDNASLLENKDAFIKRMESSINSYELLLIVKSITKLNDKKFLDESLSFIRNRRDEFKSAEVWEKKLQNFLKENKLKL